MSYELQVYALSPVRPSPREILARAAESGVAVEAAPAPGTARAPDAATWERILLRAGDAPAGGFLVEASQDLDRMKQEFRADLESGDEIPEQVLEAASLYVLELDAESPGGEDHQAAFVVTAWAIAGLTEGIVFDPQEEFFADADSFWGIITDESLGDEQGVGHAHEDERGGGHDHAGSCCGGGSATLIEIPRGPSRAPEVQAHDDSHRRNRE